MTEITQILTTAQDLITKFGLNLIAALAILLIGQWLSKLFRRFMKRLMSGAGVDPTLVSFASNLLYYSILGFVVIAALNRLGVQTASVIALLGAAGLAVGLALQGSLSNFAAGVLMVIFRPFKVGDYVEAAGVKGIVEDIQLFTTTLVGLDNTVAIVPNASISGDKIVNYTRKDKRRVDAVVGISYGDNIAKARQVILDQLAQDPRILPEPAPQVVVLELADSSVNLGVRPWVETAHYWPVYYSIYESIKNRLDAEGITIPFPQRDLHLFQHH